jgi:hypothetical protein
MKVFIFTMIAKKEYPQINPYYCIVTTGKNVEAAKNSPEYKYASQYYNSLIYAEMAWWRYLAVLLPWHHQMDEIKV